MRSSVAPQPVCVHIYRSTLQKQSCGWLQVPYTYQGDRGQISKRMQTQGTFKPGSSPKY